MYVYLRAKFEFSSLIVTSFRHVGGGGVGGVGEGEILPPPFPTSERTSKKPTQINNQLSKHVTSAFKICYNQTDAYHKKKNILVGPKPFGSYKITPFI